MTKARHKLQELTSAQLCSNEAQDKCPLLTPPTVPFEYQHLSSCVVSHSALLLFPVGNVPKSKQNPIKVKWNMARDQEQSEQEPELELELVSGLLIEELSCSHANVGQPEAGAGAT